MGEVRNTLKSHITNTQLKQGIRYGAGAAAVLAITALVLGIIHRTAMPGNLGMRATYKVATTLAGVSAIVALVSFAIKYDRDENQTTTDKAKGAAKGAGETVVTTAKRWFF